MATGKKRVRFTLDVNLPSAEAKAAFVSRLERVRTLLTPPGTRKLDTYGLMQALFACAEATGTPPVVASAPVSGNNSGQPVPGPSIAEKYLVENAGIMHAIFTWYVHAANVDSYIFRDIYWGQRR